MGSFSKRFATVAVVWASLFVATGYAQQTLQSGNAEKPASIQPEWHYRYDLFQMLLQQSGLEVTTNINAAFSEPDATVIVIIGQFNPRIFSADLQRFLPRGALLIASDSMVRLPWLFEIRPGPVTSDDAQTQYQNFNDVLRVPAIRSDDALVQGIDQLVVNRSGWISQLTPALGSWSIHAKLPQGVQPTTSQARPILASYQSDQSDRAIFLLASDQSLFSNGMLWHGDNSLLAINVCRKLASHGRNRLLFIVDGVVQGGVQSELDDKQSAQQPPATPPSVNPPPPDAIPPLTADQMVRVANEVIGRIEDSDLHNELVANQPRNMPQFRYERILWLILGFFSLFFILLRLLARSRRPSLSQRDAPINQPAAWRAMGLVGTLPRDSRKLGEYAQRMVRESLQRLTGSTDPRQWENFVTKHLSPDVLNRHIADVRLSEIATADELPSFDLRRLQRTLRVLHELEAAAVNGTKNLVESLSEKGSDPLRQGK
jgi:hypothetical protein